jgi:hypothetical protein
MVASGPPSGGVASAFESVFVNYSERTLTFAKDRPYAIAGLERRLTELYKTRTSYGIVHCCLGRSLLWQRGGEERREKISDPGVEVVPSWSWMKHEGEIRYKDIPKINTDWNRDIKLTPTSLNGHEQLVLAASVWRILQGCCIEASADTTCDIKDAEGRLVGCIKFDDKDEADIGRLGCVVIAWQISGNWTELRKDTWQGFAVSWHKNLEPGYLSCVLMVTYPARKQGYGVEVCNRLGVAVIRQECLSANEPPQTSWVI